MKSPEEIIEEYPSPTFDGEWYHKKAILRAMEEYANQFREDNNEMAMSGEVTQMGTMYVNDEFLTGVFVMCDPDEFNKITSNLLYQNVTIREK